jgi:hypothetical protein
MAQIINDPSLGASLGESFGTGLTNTLNLLAQHKIEELMYQKGIKRAAKGFEPLFGKKASETFASWSPDLQKAALQNPGLIQLLLGGESEGEEQQAQPQQSPMMSSLQNIQGPNQVQGPTPQQQQFLHSLANPELSPRSQNPIFGQQHQAQQLPQQPIAQQQVQAEPNVVGQGPKETAIEKKARLIADAFKSTEQRKLESEERRSAFKETKEERQKILEEGRSAKETLRDLDRMEELNKEGKLDTPGYTEFLKRSGLDIPALMNPESQEFQKIAQNFLRDAKTYFGGKVSNFEVEQFLKTIPSLSQSPEGRQRVIAGLKNIANAKKAYADTYLEIFNESKGVPPLDVNEQIYERVDKRLDKLSEKFRQDLSKEVPKGQHKLITALQAGAGSAAKIAAPAIAGAALGSIIPGVGTAAGGAAGGLYGLTSPFISRFLNSMGQEG